MTKFVFTIKNKDPVNLKGIPWYNEVIKDNDNFVIRYHNV
jgi:hypothetical protein